MMSKLNAKLILILYKRAKVRHLFETIVSNKVWQMNFNYRTKKNLSRQTKNMAQNECKSKVFMDGYIREPYWSMKNELELTIRDNCPQSRVSMGLSLDRFFLLIGRAIIVWIAFGWFDFSLPVSVFLWSILVSLIKTRGCLSVHPQCSCLINLLWLILMVKRFIELWRMSFPSKSPHHLWHSFRLLAKLISSVGRIGLKNLCAGLYSSVDIKAFLTIVCLVVKWLKFPMGVASPLEMEKCNEKL